MYQALYRKYRPQTFDDVIGQEHITVPLKNQVSSGRLSHAYIFIGVRGTGKTTCARILAKAVNCENPVNGNPCCRCRSCLGIADGSIMDIVELDAASNNGVDNVRALRDEAVFSPSELKKRVYIIDEVHMLSTPAFNALLKILEEPPEHLLFILATTELQKVPATILSRCQRHSFRRIEYPKLADHIESVSAKENLSIERNAAELIAGLAEGSVRDALSMLDQCSNCGNITVDAVYNSVGLAGTKRIISMFRSILNGQTAEALDAFNSMWREGKDPAGTARELSGLCRDVLMIKLAGANAASIVYGGYDKSELKALADSKSVAEFAFILETLNGVNASKGDPKTALELAIIKMCISDVPETAERRTIEPRKAEPKDEASRAIERIAAEMKPEEQRTAETKTEEKKTADTKPVEQKLAETKPEAPKTVITDDSGFNFPQLVDKIKGAFRKDLYFFIKDPMNARAELSGNVLNVKAVAGFHLNELSKPASVAAIENALESLYGRKIKVNFSELKDFGKTRDISELKQFPEVTFINN